MTHVSVFSGIGGLDLAFGTPDVVCESDPGCQAVLARRFPDARLVTDVRDLAADTEGCGRNEGAENPSRSGPRTRTRPEQGSDGGSAATANADGERRRQEPRSTLGDEGEAAGRPAVRDHVAGGLGPCELLTAGFPCQPFSHAGNRKGEQDDRYLWPILADTIRTLRPRRVFLENVPGLLTLRLATGEPVIGRVLADLAEAGYVGRWVCVRASDVGAPHRRERIFILATDANRGRRQQRDARVRRVPVASPDRSRSAADTDGPGRGEHGGPVAARPEHAATERGRESAPDSERERWAEGRSEQEGREGQSLPVRYSTAAADPDGERRQPGCGWRTTGGDRARADETQHDGDRLVGQAEPGTWGAYAPAISRWEHTLGRPAPAPTDDRGRLNVPFVEWMMGLPEGWVDGLGRTVALRALGNAVVPQQAALAWRLLNP